MSLLNFGGAVTDVLAPSPASRLPFDLHIRMLPPCSVMMRLCATSTSRSVKMSKLPFLERDEGFAGRIDRRRSVCTADQDAAARPEELDVAALLRLDGRAADSGRRRSDRRRLCQ
jgi:hypothetical protein